MNKKSESIFDINRELNEAFIYEGSVKSHYLKTDVYYLAKDFQTSFNLNDFYNSSKKILGLPKLDFIEYEGYPKTEFSLRLYSKSELENQYFNPKSLLSIYDQLIAKAKKFSIPYMIAADIFLKYSGAIGISFEDVLKMLLDSRGKRILDADYNYTLGLLYFFQVQSKFKSEVNIKSNDRIEFFVSFPNPQALVESRKFLLNSIKKDKNNAELHYLLAACNAAMGNINQAVDSLERGDNLYSLSKRQPGLITQNCFDGYRMALNFLVVNFIRQGKYDDKAYKTAIMLANLDDLSIHSYVLLFTYLQEFDKYYEIVNILQTLRKSGDMKPFGVHLMGLTCLLARKYYFASLYFEREIKIWEESGEDPERGIAQALYAHSLGMMFWRKGILDKAEEHFIYSSRIMRSIGLREYDHLRIIPLLIESDNVIKKLAECNTKKDFLDNLLVANKLFVKTIRDSSIFLNIFAENFVYSEDYITSAKEQHRSSMAFLTYLLTGKFMFLIILNHVIKESESFNRIINIWKKYLRKIMDKKIDVEPNPYDFQITGIKIFATLLRELGFEKEALAVYTLNTFLEKLASRTINEISENVWKKLMKILQPVFELFCYEATQKLINRIILNNVGNITIELGSEQIIKEEEKPKKVLTYDGKKELWKTLAWSDSRSEEQKEEYFLWIDEREEGILVNGEPKYFTDMHIHKLPKHKKILIYLLEWKLIHKKDPFCTAEHLYNKFKQKGKPKYKKYEKKCRSTFIKWTSVINTTVGKSFIKTGKNQDGRFGCKIEGEFKFCIIYSEKKN